MESGIDPTNLLVFNFKVTILLKDPMVFGREPAKELEEISRVVKSVNDPIEAGNDPVIKAVDRDKDITLVVSHMTPYHDVPEQSPVATAVAPDPVQLQPLHIKADFRAAIFVVAIRAHRAMWDPGDGAGAGVGATVGRVHWP